MNDRSALFTDSVLTDLYADAWFTAQHDVTALYSAPVKVATVDLWDGDLAEIHAFLTAHPAF